MSTPTNPIIPAVQPSPQTAAGCAPAALLCSLRFDELRLANVARCEEVFHKLNEWSSTDWATAMAGECGEACNLIKKLRRGELITREMIGDELADLIIYTDLLSARLGIDLGEAVVRKFNIVSDRRSASLRLHNKQIT